MFISLLAAAAVHAASPQAAAPGAARAAQFELRLSEEDLNIIADAMLDKPIRVDLPVLNKITSQVQAQLQAAAAAQKAPAPKK